MISEQDVARVQRQLGELALQAVRIDLDGFIEASEAVGSAQALSVGISPRAVTSAGEWAEMARLLKPFRDHVAGRYATLQAELRDEDLVRPGHGCPSCGERRVDCLIIQDDESVRCGTCDRQYELPEHPREGER